MARITGIVDVVGHRVGQRSGFEIGVRDPGVEVMKPAMAMVRGLFKGLDLGAEHGSRCEKSLRLMCVKK